jgi:5'-methylthioadenosine phosphorylase
MKFLMERDSMKKYKLGIIAKSGSYAYDFKERMKLLGFRRFGLKTPYGFMDRLYKGSVHGKDIIIVEGRFEKTRTPSNKINFRKIVSSLKIMGVENLIGCFSVGAVKDYPLGSVFVPHDFIGIGNYDQNLYRKDFKNMDMYRPFCEPLRQAVIKASGSMDFPVIKKGICICFHGYPRIETRAELNAYRMWGADIVCQTMDPEATLAREAGMCYAAICSTIDSGETREKFMDSDLEGREMTRKYLEISKERILKLALASVRHVGRDGNCICGYDYSKEDY